MSAIRQNFHADSEAAINKQINMELYASYFYLALAYQFDRHDVALEGFHKYFKDSSHEEREHAEKFMKYLNQRGGTITLEPIQPPKKFDYKTGVEAMRAALELEREVNKSLLNIHKVASQHNDAHLTDFLEEEYLDEQVESIKKLGDYVTNLERVGPGLGEYQFDKLSLE
jgi:ferritin heavy chain